MTEWYRVLLEDYFRNDDMTSWMTARGIKSEEPMVDLLPTPGSWKISSLNLNQKMRVIHSQELAGHTCKCTGKVSHSSSYLLGRDAHRTS